MTSFMQAEFEALAMESRKTVTEVKVNSSITNHPSMLTNKELEMVTSVFRSLETGLREASIYPKVGIITIMVSRKIMLYYQDLDKAMKMLGLNMTDQDMVDIPNKIMRCKVINTTLVCYFWLSGMATFSSLIFAS